MMKHFQYFMRNLSKKKKEEIKEVISFNANEWLEAKSAGEFLRKKLGANGNADKLANNIIEKSLAEEKPEWTKLLLETMKVETKEAPTTNNLFLLNEKISDNLQKIIDVTPKTNSKSPLEELI